MASRAQGWIGTSDIITGDEQRKLREAFSATLGAYFDGPWVRTPEALVAELAEVDSAVLQDLLLQLNWEPYGLGYGGDTRQERQRAVKESRRLWKYSVVAQWQINLWTNYGLGENIIVTPLDKSLNSSETDDEGNPVPLAEHVWREFWTADRNQPLLAADRIQDLSNWLLVDGERFLAHYASDLDGETRVRTLDPEEIVEVLADPDDALTPWFYKRQFNTDSGGQRILYYPDWQVFFADEEDSLSLDEKAEKLKIEDDERADKQPAANVQVGARAEAGTVVCVLHVAHNRKDPKSLRGWPLLAPAGIPWIRAHKKFREDRAAVAAAAAMFVQKIKHKGGSRAGLGLRAQLQTALTMAQNVETNPPPVAGSTWIGNEAVDLEKISNIGTAAGDAKADGEAMLLMAGLAGGVFPHWMGAGDAYRLATATSMEGPLLRQFSRYQLFWSSQFRKMVRIVLQFHERYSKVEFETYDAEVSTDRLVEADLAMVTASVGQFYREVLVPQAELMTLDPDVMKAITAAVTRVVLQALGVADPDELASDEAFGVGVEPKEEPEEEMPEEWAAELARVVRENYEAGEAPAEAVADWALATLLEVG